MVDYIADSDGGRGFRFDNQLATRIEAPLIHHPEPANAEIIRNLTKRTTCQKFKACLGGIKGPAVKLALLDHPYQLVEAWIGGFHIDPEFGETRHHVRLAGLV